MCCEKMEDECIYAVQDMSPTGCGDWFCLHPKAKKSEYDNNYYCNAPDECPLEVKE